MANDYDRYCPKCGVLNNHFARYIFTGSIIRVNNSSVTGPVLLIECSFCGYKSTEPCKDAVDD